MPDNIPLLQSRAVKRARPKTCRNLIPKSLNFVYALSCAAGLCASPAVLADDRPLADVYVYADEIDGEHYRATTTANDGSFTLAGLGFVAMHWCYQNMTGLVVRGIRLDVRLVQQEFRLALLLPHIELLHQQPAEPFPAWLAIEHGGDILDASSVGGGSAGGSGPIDSKPKPIT